MKTYIFSFMNSNLKGFACKCHLMLRLCITHSSTHSGVLGYVSTSFADQETEIFQAKLEVRSLVFEIYIQ